MLSDSLSHWSARRHGHPLPVRPEGIGGAGVGRFGHGRPQLRWFPDGLSDDEIPLPATDAADPADRAFPDGFREWSTNGIHPTRVSDGDAGHFSVFGGVPGRPAASEARHGWRTGVS